MSASGQEPSQMSGIGPEVLQDVQEWLWRPHGCPSVIERPSEMSGSGREAPRMFVSSREPDQMSVIDPESLQDAEEWSVVPHGCLGVVGSPSRMTGSGR